MGNIIKELHEKGEDSQAVPSGRTPKHSTATDRPYLGSAPLDDLLGRGVKLALQLAALLPVIKHLHLVGTELGATQVSSQEFTLLCNTSGQLSPGRPRGTAQMPR